MNIYENADLSKLLWYKIGGRARYLLEVTSRNDFIKACEFLHHNNIPKFMVIGLGANLIFNDDFYDGAIVRTLTQGENSLHKESVSKQIQLVGEDIVEAFAGELLDDVIQFTFDHNLIGLEWAGGLPSTIGAAVRGNVGAFGGEIKDSLENGEVMEFMNGACEIKVISNSDFNFGYRDSLLKKNRNMVLVTAQLKLKKASFEELEKARQTYDSHKEYRKQHHPLDYPNCGSVFKNIKKQEEVEKVLQVIPEISEKIHKDWHGKVSMGYIIHYLGLSGFRVGNAQVSEKHNNFIINLGGARFSDVVGIIKIIQDKCEETFGFKPEPEVEIVS